MPKNTPLTPDNQALIFALWTAGGNQLLTKGFTHNPNGTPDKLPKVNAHSGTGENYLLTGNPYDMLVAANALFDTLQPNQAPSLTAMVNYAPGETARLVVSKVYERDAERGTVARAGTCMGVHPQATRKLILFDVDVKDMPPEVRARIAELGGVIPALTRLIPGLQDAAWINRASVSTGVHNTDTAPPPIGDLRNGHIYLIVPADLDVKKFLDGVVLRGWPHGLSYWTPSASGGLLQRSIVDASVGGPERLVFEAPPVLGPGVSRMHTPTTFHSGGVLGDHPPLTDDETRTADRLSKRAKRAKQPEADQRKAEWIKKRTGVIMERPGMTRERAEAIVSVAGADQLLDDDFMLEMQDGDFVSVAEILDNPVKWNGNYIPDPFEGREYGTTTAQIKLTDPRAHIVSFAHGEFTDFYFARHQTEGYLPAPPAGKGTPQDGRDKLKDVLTNGTPGRRMPSPDLLSDKMKFHAPRQLALNRWAALPLDERGDPPPMPDLSVLLSKIAMGTGKTRALEENLGQIATMADAYWGKATGWDRRVSKPPVVLALERGVQIDEFMGDVDRQGRVFAALKGRNQDDGTGKPLCQRHEAAEEVAKISLSVKDVLCKTCPFKDGCAYIDSVDEARRADVVVCTHNHTQQSQANFFPHGVMAAIFDEDPTRKMLDGSLKCTVADLRALNAPGKTMGPPNIDPFADLLDDLVRHRDYDNRLPRFDVDFKALGEVRNGFNLELWDGKITNVEDDAAVIEQCVELAVQQHRIKCAVALITIVFQGAGNAKKKADAPQWGAMPKITITEDGLIRLMVPKRLHLTWDATPKVVLSGTANPDLLSLALNGARVETTTISPEWSPYARARQITDRNYSLAQLLTADDQPTPLLVDVVNRYKARMDELGATADKSLFIAQKRVVEAVEDLLPEGVVTMHFNALTGRNEAETCRYAVVLGRFLPPTYTFEDIAEGVSTYAPLRLPQNTPLPYRDEGLNIGRQDGLGVPATGVPYHIDPRTDAILQMTVRGELDQAVGRVRAINRTAETPVQVDIYCNMPLELTVHEWGTHDDFAPTVADDLRVRGVSFDPLAHGGQVLAGKVLKVERRVVTRRLEAEWAKQSAVDAQRQHYATLGLPQPLPTHSDFARPAAPTGSTAVIDGVPVMMRTENPDVARWWAMSHNVTLTNWQAKDDSVESLVRHLARQPVDQMRMRGTGAGTLRGRIAAYLKLDVRHAAVGRLVGDLRMTKRFRSERLENGDFAVF